MHDSVVLVHNHCAKTHESKSYLYRNLPVPSFAILTPSKLRITSDGCRRWDSGAVGSILLIRTPFWSAFIPIDVRRSGFSIFCHSIPIIGNPVPQLTIRINVSRGEEIGLIKTNNHTVQSVQWTSSYITYVLQGPYVNNNNYSYSDFFYGLLFFLSIPFFFCLTRSAH